jgi:hypothetical protein
MTAHLTRVAGIYRHFADARQPAIALREARIAYKIESFANSHIVFVTRHQYVRARQIEGRMPSASEGAR